MSKTKQSVPSPSSGAPSDLPTDIPSGAPSDVPSGGSDHAVTEIVQTVPDKNGFQWVHVPRADAHAHSKGRPGLILWLIAGWFAASGGLEVALVVAAGTPWWSGILGIGSLVAGVGLILRVPWAYVLAVLLPARFVVGFVMAIGGGAQGLSGAAQADQVFVLVQAVIAVAVTFHLIEGERPNLIYRLRYRSYAAERAVEAQRGAGQKR